MYVGKCWGWILFIHIFIIYLMMGFKNVKILSFLNLGMFIYMRLAVVAGLKTTATAIGNDLNEKCYDGFLHPDLQSFKILTIYYDF